MRNAIRSDHLATWTEVRDALECMSLDGREIDRDCKAGIDFEAESGDGDGLVDECAWLALASEAQDSRSN